jgi:hypothetical protein
LSYQVFVAQDGSITRYKPERGTLSNQDVFTPLPDLQFQPARSQVKGKEPLAIFLIVFNYNRLQVIPWHGFKSEPTLGPQIIDCEQLATLKESLWKTLEKTWITDNIKFSDELDYRVGVTEQGQIADYEPSNQAAFDYDQYVPLNKLLRPETAGILPGKSRVPSQPLGQFKVTFKPDGTLDINTWDD